MYLVGPAIHWLLAALQGDDVDAIHDAWGELQDQLFLMRAEGLKLVAEFSALSLQHLVSLAISLQPDEESDSLPVSGLNWPPGAYRSQ